MQRFEQILERLLWASRLMVVVAVVASVVMALATIYLATVDALVILGRIVGYGAESVERSIVRTEIITGIVKAVDAYLIAAILLIFGLGLYELFVNKIDVAQHPEAPRLLQVRSFDHLKDRVAKMILLVLIVEFFQYALRIPYDTPLDLLYLALGVVAIGAALYLTREKPANSTASPAGSLSATQQPTSPMMRTVVERPQDRQVGSASHDEAIQPGSNN